MSLPSYLMLLSDGALHDTRSADWSRQRPLRPVYSRHLPTIRTVCELKACLRAGPYVDGGYPVYFLLSDGETLSFQAARECFREVTHALRNETRDGWRITALCVNYEETGLRCAHTGEAIECAYAPLRRVQYVVPHSYPVARMTR